jgi:hypothetical protein
MTRSAGDLLDHVEELGTDVPVEATDPEKVDRFHVSGTALCHLC